MKPHIEDFILGGAGFSPKALTNLAVWFDAADTSSLTIATGVSQWRDKSGNGFHAAQSTGSQQPISGTRTINGKNVLDFRGNLNADYMTFSGSMTPNTLVWVGFSDETTFLDWRGAITARTAASTKTADSAYASGFTGDVSVANAICNTGQTTVSISIDGVAGTAANFDNFAVGQSINPASSPHIILWTDDNGAAATQNYAIGADTFDTVTHRHWDGVIAEIIIYNRALSAAEQLKLITYLKKKWGIA